MAWIGRTLSLIPLLGVVGGGIALLFTSYRVWGVVLLVGPISMSLLAVLIKSRRRFANRNANPS